MTLLAPDQLAALRAFIKALHADGLPTGAAYVSRRLQEAGLSVPHPVVTRECRSVPFVPERPRPRPVTVGRPNARTGSGAPTA